MKKHRFTQDASKRLVNFYLDEAVAYQLDKVCDIKGVSRTQMLAGIVAELVADVELTAEDNQAINEAIQKRLDLGYNKSFKSKERYHRE